LPIINRENIRMAVIGPEAPLTAGLADDLRAAGILAFGPGREGALLEGSKSHAKKFMDRHGIPTARWDLCTTAEEARSALDSRHAPFVVKADGLAAGKGVVVTQSREEALDAARGMLERGRHGEAGKKIVIEDGLAGDELTILALTDGTTYRLLSPSQDHKRAFDGDKGPNTGGMGAYSPVPWLGSELLEKICSRVLSPTVEGLKKDGIPYCGVIYAGLMIDGKGEPSVIEYNVRFGDPEAQVVLPVLEGDFAELLLACCESRLSEIKWKDPSRWAVDVVIASGGYPGHFEKGKKIEGLEKASELEDFVIFHGGTERSDDGCLVTSGGRVLSAVGLGNSLTDALKKAYEGVSLISFDGMHFRRDIGRKALL
jgi:phosphoribosylamine--glycine ligase